MPDTQQPLETVLLIHSGGLGAMQWRRLGGLLGRERLVLARDLLGYGTSPALDLSPGAPAAPDQDLAYLLDLFDATAGVIHVVGHSYGGLLATRLAFARPGRVRSLALFEPVLRGVLRSTGQTEALADSAVWATLGPPGSVDWIRAFVDYWGGPGAYDRMSPTAREAFLASRWTVAAEVLAIDEDPTPLSAYAALRMPALVARGESTPPLSLQICEALSRGLPNGELSVIAGAGHMAPVTHPKETLALLERLWTRARLAAPVDSH